MLNSSTPPESLYRRLAEIAVERRDIFDVHQYPFESDTAKAKINELNGEARRIRRHLLSQGLSPRPRPPEFKVGDQVTHEKWGRGEVIAVIHYPRVTFYDVRYANGDVHSHPGRQLTKVEQP